MIAPLWQLVFIWVWLILIQTFILANFIVTNIDEFQYETPYKTIGAKMLYLLNPKVQGHGAKHFFNLITGLSYRRLVKERRRRDEAEIEALCSQITEIDKYIDVVCGCAWDIIVIPVARHVSNREEFIADIAYVVDNLKRVLDGGFGDTHDSRVLGYQLRLFSTSHGLDYHYVVQTTYDWMTQTPMEEIFRGCHNQGYTHI